ncbi:hypothetical protein O7622_17445 [Micromonospora sp. WMMD1076]|uniref:hypothetical protein n=1 Tax=Micromonospora sp. WMMD1076 TaxID=3016103 RepID=UPI00249C7A4E|nr:hypothetical protein [Micromonospora sp. WMMD1076]WFF04852.1 hypothetical protein O7622_17445 [Micromonospora sp. WMMD1076]
MRAAMATDAGHPGRANEDFAGAVPCGMVLVDGAGGIAGADEVCRHGIAWYATRLGGALLGALPEERSLRDVLAEGIERITDAHRQTCDVAHPISPFAAVAMLRFSGDSVEHLVLGDAVAVVGRAHGEPLVAHDPREVVIARSFEERLTDVPEGGDEYRRLLMELRSRRNSPGGFWVAKDDPTVVAEAVTGECPAGEVRTTALLSNGASRLVDTFGLTGWPGLLRLLETDGPAEVVRRVREAEAREGAATDDATIVCRY